MAKRHYHRVDLLKGIAILLVVAGHALDYNTASHVGEHFLWRDYLFWLIYSFHMQLFFALSGFLDGGSSADRLSFIRRKAVRLLVPYFFVGLLYMPFKMGLSALARQTFDPSVLWQIFLGNNPDAGLWFLYVLFLISVIVRLIATEKTEMWLLIAAAAASVYVHSFGIEWLPYVCFSRIFKYLFFYLAGRMIRRYADKHDTSDLMTKLGKASPLFVVGAVGLFSLNVFRVQSNALQFPTAVLCCLAVVALVGLIREGSFIDRRLALYGGETMGIYIIHGPIQVAARTILWSLLHLPFPVVTVVKYAVGLYAAHLLTRYVVSRIPLLRLLILGERTKR